MANFDLIKPLSISTPTKIVLLVIDGLGGLPQPATGKTELETAKKPNLDKLAAGGICGLSDPVSPGITPGSAPGHLGLFGYDPLVFNIGRGALEAVGVDFDLRPGDVAARGNFCSVDDKGLITDRRAGRISTEKSSELCKLLDGMVIDNTKIFVQPVREHRFIVVFRGKDLSPDLNDTDPQREGITPLVVSPANAKATKTAAVANKFINQAKVTLAGHHPANMVLLRGFSVRPNFPTMTDIYKLKPVAIAIYPMYRGLARLVGMEILDAGTTVEEEFNTLAEQWSDYDFFFLHIKGGDSAGEDGDFDRKVKVIEQVDGLLPQLIKLKPDVIVITGDHSTPALLKGHSWHPVPVLLCSQFCRTDKVTGFGESACVLGGLGRIHAMDIMPLAMANALKLTKYGA